MEIKEFNIPVPWGHVAVKAWGNEKDTPVFAVHGMQDNAGIFDRIVPFLPPSFYYICIDLPSHGRSSLFPTQMFIGPMDVIVTYKLILDYLGRERYILLGHSWGAQTFVVFTQLFPQYAIKLILIDAVYPFPTSAVFYKGYWTSRIENLLKINYNITNRAPPSYTYNEAMEKLTATRMVGRITKDTAECLLKRCLKPVATGKFNFTTDPRLKVFLIAGYDIEYIVKVMKANPIKCPILLMKALRSSVETWSQYHLLFEELEPLPNWNIVEIKGNHDDFSNHPASWAAVISKFLCTESSKL